jgi:hypothetical protein
MHSLRFFPHPGQGRYEEPLSWDTAGIQGGPALCGTSQPPWPVYLSPALQPHSEGAILGGE